MPRKRMSLILAGLLVAGFSVAALFPEMSLDDAGWKRLKKMRVRAGVMIGKGRPNYTEAYVHLTDVRAKLEEAGIQESVTIMLFTDFGTKLFLGTYAPVITAREDGGQAVTFPGIPNAFLVTRAFAYKVGDLYPFQFLDSSGKVRATIRIRLMGQVDQTF